MKLIIGLGNPGEKYERTRHNAGFWLIERFAFKSGIAMRKDAKFQALVGRHADSGVWLLMPQNFMNASGRAVQMMAGFFKITPAEILVVHDELDFAPGVAKVKQGGGIAGHNGLRDISARLGSHDYWRLRIGIGHPGDRQAVSDYVLNKPSAEDHAGINAAIERSLEIMPLALAGDMQAAMLKLHTPDKPAKTAQKQPKAAENLRPEGQRAASEKPPKVDPPAKETPAPKVEPPPTAEPPPKVDPPPRPEPPARQTVAAEAGAASANQSALQSLFKKFIPKK